MKNCAGCKYAKWQTTKAGKLHPSGAGQCEFQWKAPPIPAAFYWTGCQSLRPCGGYINRREENKVHCTYYQRGDA